MRIVKKEPVWMRTTQGRWHIYDAKGDLRSQGRTLWEAVRRLFNW